MSSSAYSELTDQRGSQGFSFMSVLITLWAMYTVQSIFGGATFQGMPAVLRQEGVETEQISWIYIAMLPWTLKFLWAAPFERWRSKLSNPYRQVFLLGNITTLVILIAISALNPKDNLTLLLLGLVIIATLSATVDIAVDSYAVRNRSLQTTSWLSSAQIGGGYLGGFIGGGLFLVLADIIGWRYAILALAISIIVFLVPAIALVHNSTHKQSEQCTSRKLIDSLKQPAIYMGVMTVVIAQIGLRLGQGMIMPFLVDKGISLTELGIASAAGNLILSMVGVFIAGYLLKFIAEKLLLLSLILLQCAGYLTLYHLAGQESFSFHLASSIVLLSSSLTSASFLVLYKMMMEWCSVSRAGVDFSILQSTDTLIALIAGFSSGWLVHIFGYGEYFFICATCCLSSFALIFLLNRLTPRTTL